MLELWEDSLISFVISYLLISFFQPRKVGVQGSETDETRQTVGQPLGLGDEWE